METGVVRSFYRKSGYNGYTVWLAVLISLLLHAVLVLLLGWMLMSKPTVGDGSLSTRTLSFLLSPGDDERRKVEDEPEIEEQDPERDKRFMKTSPEQQVAESPQDAPYIGARPTDAQGGPKKPDDLKELPAQDGIKPRGDEVVLFDQDRQDGVAEHDQPGNPGAASPASRSDSSNPEQTSPTGRRDPMFNDGQTVTPLIPQIAQIHAEESRQGPPHDNVDTVDNSTLVENADNTLQDQDADTEPDERQLADTDTGSDGQTEGSREDGSPTEEQSRQKLADAIRDTLMYSDLMENSRKIAAPSPAGREEDGVRDQALALNVPQISPELPASAVVEEGTPESDAPKPQPLYDPMFTPEAQPGFRTSERKTRTTGQFSFGRIASAKVAATPMGRYQEIIYRAIGACWYRQCDINRDLIITGTLRIRILIDRNGKVSDMRLISRMGANTVQQSFTFLAIKQARIPAMPPDVANEIVGDKLELYFDFHF